MSLSEYLISENEEIQCVTSNESSCPVNFHMVGTVLFILARRMEILKRNFKVKISGTASNLIKPNPSFSITEIKIHTKKTKQGNMLASERQQYDKKSTGKLMFSSQKHSRNLPTHKKRTEKHSGDDSPSEMFSAHRDSNKKYTSNRRLTEMFPFKQRNVENYAVQVTQGVRQKTGKYIDETFPTERHEVREYSDEICIRERHKPRKHSDEITSTARNRAEILSYSDEMFSIKRRTAENYSDEMSSSNQRKSTKRSGSDGKGAGKNYSPTDDSSSKSAIIGNSRTVALRDQENKVAEVRFNEVENNDRKRQSDVRLVDDNDDDIEAHHEKIYLVTRISSGRKTGSSDAVLNPLVTQEQFNRLNEKTRLLQKQYGITSNTKAKWDNVSFLSTSMTRQNTAMNISMWLNVAETRLERMLDIVAHFAHHVPEINTEADKPPPSQEEDINLKPFKPFLKPPLPMMRRSTGAHDIHLFHSVRETNPTESELSMRSITNVTHGLLQTKLKKVQDNLLKNIREAIDDSKIEKCNKTLVKHELKVRNMNNKLMGIVKLESAVGKLGKRVAAIDARLTAQMTNFQDNLQQMEEDVEKALEKMNAALLSPKEDVAAVAQITEEFNNYDYKLNNTWHKQMDLKGEMGLCIKNLDSIEEEIEHLVDRKCSRKEMYEVLSDKVGVKDVNGQLTEDQFYAVNSDKKNTLQNLHLNIFSKECEWQKILDETYKNTQQNADQVQLKSLEESVQQYITMLDKNVKEMSVIFGPLQRYPTDKKIKRDENCLSCGAPAETVKDEGTVRIWRKMLCSVPHDAATKSTKLIKQEEAKVCLLMRPIPHPLEQDSYICQHDCGNIVTTTDFDLSIKALKPASNNSSAMHDKSHQDRQSLQE